jgi:linoleoyl-CoA desaturase
MDDLLAAARVVEVAASQAIVTQGDAPDGLYVLLDGTAAVEVQTEDGSSLVLAEIGPGAVFGEQALIGGGRRNATVRVRARVRCAMVPGEPFLRLTSSQPESLVDFFAAAVEHARTRSLRTLAVLRDARLNATDAARRIRLAPGERLFSEGDEGDAAFFVLTGTALVMQGNPAVELSRVGPGQCLGELAVLDGKPRSATVIAENDLEVLRVEAATFKTWAVEHAPLRALLGTLRQVYQRLDGARLSVYRGEWNGHPSISTLRGDPLGDCVISTQVLDAPVFLLSRGRAEADRILRFEEGDRFRELHLAVLERDDEGEIARARVLGVVARGEGPDLARMYQRVLDDEAVTAAQLRTFPKTGFLAGDALRGDADLVCRCLRIRAAEVLGAARQCGPTVQAVAAAIGASTVCGSCKPDLEALLARPAEPAAARPAAADPFGAVLEERVLSLLREQRRDPRFDRAVLLKGFVVMAWLIASYLGALFAPGRLVALAMIVSSGFAGASILTCILHDAGHGTFSSNRATNELAYCWAELLLLSGDWWRTKHGWHHRYTSTHPFDDDIAKTPLLRLNPSQPWRPHYRWQHLYAWALYPFVYPAMVAASLRFLRTGLVGAQQFDRPTAGRVARGLGLMALGATWIFAIPIYLHPAPIAIGAVLLASLIMGATLSLVFQVEHNVTGAVPPEPFSEPGPRAMAATTTNVLVDSRLFTWYSGGLNHHLEHHLFPDLNHGHFQLIRPVVEKTCAEFGVPHLAFPTFRGALVAHQQWLRKLGREP